MPNSFPPQWHPVGMMLQIIPIYSPQTHTFINAFAKNGIKLKECLFAQAVCGMHGKEPRATKKWSLNLVIKKEEWKEICMRVDNFWLFFGGGGRMVRLARENCVIYYFITYPSASVK